VAGVHSACQSLHPTSWRLEECGCLQVPRVSGVASIRSASDDWSCRVPVVIVLAAARPPHGGWRRRSQMLLVPTATVLVVWPPGCVLCGVVEGSIGVIERMVCPYCVTHVDVGGSLVCLTLWCHVPVIQLDSFVSRRSPAVHFRRHSMPAIVAVQAAIACTRSHHCWSPASVEPHVYSALTSYRHDLSRDCSRLQSTGRRVSSRG
jgi:hypothetical protein